MTCSDRLWQDLQFSIFTISLPELGVFNASIAALLQTSPMGEAALPLFRQKEHREARIGVQVSLPQATRLLQHSVSPLEATMLQKARSSSDSTCHEVERRADANQHWG